MRIPIAVIKAVLAYLGAIVAYGNFLLSKRLLRFKGLGEVSSQLYSKAWHAFCIRHGIVDLYWQSASFAKLQMRRVCDEAGYRLLVREPVKNSYRQVYELSFYGPAPDLFDRVRINRKLIAEFRRFQLSKAAELTGLTEKDVEYQIRQAELLGIFLQSGNRNIKAENLAVLLHLCETYPTSFFFTNPRVRTLATIEVNCSNHFPTDQFEEVVDAMPEFGLRLSFLFHMLICERYRSRQYKHLTRCEWFTPVIHLKGARPARDRYLVRSNYSISDLRRLKQLLNENKLDLRFLSSCVVEWGILDKPDSLLLLSRLVSGDFGVEIPLAEAAKLFHRGIPIENIASMHRVLGFDWLTFNQAETATKSNALPELAEAMQAHMESPSFTDLLTLKNAAVYEGIELVMKKLGQLKSAEKVVAYFALQRSLSETVPEKRLEDAVRQTDSLEAARRLLIGDRAAAPVPVPDKPTVGRKRRRKTQTVGEPVRTNGRIEPEAVIQQNRENIPASLLPVWSARRWRSAIKKGGNLGWNIKRWSGSHAVVELRRDGRVYQFTHTLDGRENVDRYMLTSAFKNSGVPRAEIEKLIGTR